MPPLVPVIFAGAPTLICPLPLLNVVKMVPVTFALAGLLSAPKLVCVLSVMFAQVNVAVLSEMLAVAFFVMLTPKFTVFAAAGAANVPAKIRVAVATFAVCQNLIAHTPYG